MSNTIPENNFDLDSKAYKNLRLAVNVISIILPVLVGIMFQFKFTDFQWPFDVYILPLTNAILNASSAVLLIGALVAIKNRNVVLHTRLIYAAMVLSLLFLVVYILYHTTAGHTKFGGEGTIRLVYFVLLLTHIVTAAIQAPFVLYAFLYGYTGQYEKHLRIVKISYPLWLYVSITGVICYLMISPYYGLPPVQ
jgi:putative membrane protein